MSRAYIAAILVTVASSPLVFGQETHNLAQDDWAPLQRTPLNTIVRGQSPAATPVDFRRSPDLMQIPEYRDLLDEFNETQAELGRLQEQLDSTGIEDHGDHFYFTNNVVNNEIYQPGEDMGGGGGGGGGGDVATQSQNPVGGLWMMWLQNDMKLYEGGVFDGKRIFNTTVFQPVMPVQLNDRWKLINRPVFLFHNFEVPGGFDFNPGGTFPSSPPADPFSTQSGLGDTGLIQWLSGSPASSKMVTGIGWNWMFPTATNQEFLGTGRTSLGPSAVAMYLGDKIITGGILQQYFSIDSRQDRTRVSYMDLQYVFRYRINPMFGIGFAPNMKWDQVTGKVTMPIGFGFDTMTMAKGGKLPMRWGAELQYYASHERSRGLDLEWNFRLYVSPIIKAPEWATRGLFCN